MFDKDQFIADCEAAVDEDPSHVGVREIVALSPIRTLS